MSVLSAIGSQQVLPVLRLPSVDEAVRAAMAVLEAGLAVVELTATTPGWEKALTAVCADLPPGCCVGLGTVTDAATAEAAIAAGAAFLVSPWAAPAVRQVAAAAGVLFLEGAFSPTEIAASAAHGPVKVFPASAVDPGYLRALRPVLPRGTVLVPTGSIRLADVPRWLGAGAYAVGVGADLFTDDGRTVRLAELRSATSGVA